MVQRAVAESPKFQCMMQSYDQVRFTKPLHKTYDGEQRSHYTVSFKNQMTGATSSTYHIFPNLNFTRFTHVTEVVQL